MRASGACLLRASGAAGATIHRLYRGTVAAGEDRWSDSTSTTYVDDGTKSYTLSAVATATFWQVKNLIELKAAQNVQMDSNIFDTAWSGSDIGYTWGWFKSVNQDGAAWWIESKNITIEKNLIRHTNGVAIVHGRETNGTVRPPAISNVTIKNNLFIDASNVALQEGAAAYALSVGGATTFVFDRTFLRRIRSQRYPPSRWPPETPGVSVH